MASLEISFFLQYGKPQGLLRTGPHPVDDRASGKDWDCSHELLSPQVKMFIVISSTIIIIKKIYDSFNRFEVTQSQILTPNLGW